MRGSFEILQVKELESTKPVRSHFVSPLTLALIRSFWLLFCIVAIINKLVYHYNLPIKYVMYLTNLSFYGLTAYLSVSTYLSWRYVFNPEYIPWSGLHWGYKFPYFLLYQSSLLLSCIVTTIYWSLLAKKELASQVPPMFLYLSISMHAFNLIITITEGVLSQNPVILIHLPIILTITLLYLPYAILVHHIYGIWPYFFLDYTIHPQLFIGVILGIIILAIIFQLMLTKLHQLRDKRFEKKIY